MHELSLAQSLIEQLLHLAQEHKAERITRVAVTLGPFSGIVRDSFEFGFNIIKESDVVTREALLELITPDPEYTCLDCGTVAVIPFSLQTDRLESVLLGPAAKHCSGCGSNRLSPQGGTELILNQVEME
jgi:hydrogenase nickel incorporation protein HypA/HybF